MIPSTDFIGIAEKRHASEADDCNVLLEFLDRQLVNRRIPMAGNLEKRQFSGSIIDVFENIAWLEEPGTLELHRGQCFKRHDYSARHDVYCRRITNLATEPPETICR